MDPNIKFARAKNGYDPQEVDAVFEEFLRQLEDHKKKIRDLQGVISQYHKKLQFLTENPEKLEEERAQESLRVTGIMNNVALAAEQIEAEAQQKAEAMCAQAQREIGEILERMRGRRKQPSAPAPFQAAGTPYAPEPTGGLFPQGENLPPESSPQMEGARYLAEAGAQLDRIDRLLEDAFKDLLSPDALASVDASALCDAAHLQDILSAPVFGQIAAVPPYTEAQQPQIPPFSQPTASRGVFEDDPYTVFLREAGPEVPPPKYPRKERSDKYFGHFGN